MNVNFINKSQVDPYDATKFNADDANEVKNAVNSKVDQVGGKQLSTEDYSTAEKSKLSGVAPNATANSADATLLNRANHTGNQAIATITNLQSSLDNKEDLQKFTKSSHGFGVGWLVYRDGSQVWQRSNGDADDAEARGGVVVLVPDANTFVIGPPGTRFTGSGFTAGPYYLDITTTSTPNYTITAPSIAGQVEREIFYAFTSTDAVVTNSQYQQITAPATLTVADGTISDAKLATDNKVGSLSLLTTSVKTTAVGAINELKAFVDGIGGSGSSTGADKDYISLPPLSTPGSFTATAFSDTQINLSWADISGEVHYILHRSATSNAGFSTIATLAPGTTSYSDMGRTASTTYYYKLKAEGDAWTTRDSGWAFANATTSAGGGGGPTVEQSILLNFITAFSGPNIYSGVQDVDDTGGTAIAAGTAQQLNVVDSTNTVTTVDFLLTSAGIGAFGNLAQGNDPNDTAVFNKQYVTAQSWFLNDNGTFKLSGLTPSRHYNLFFWSYCNPWENRVVYFSANGTDTTQIPAHGNTGDATGDPLLDSTLREITVLSDGSGEILMTAHFVSSTSGSTGVPLTALYVQRLSS